jgi:glucose-1-phosphate cytidylyltransferase
MKAVILAGGRGTRLTEETQLKPKPLVEANGKPLIWHIMQNFSRHGVTDFIILSGYKGQQIREYFANFWLHQADLTFDLETPNQEVHKVRGLPWKVTVLDTGIDTNTGGRIARLKGLLNEDFLLTYGDGVSDIDIQKLITNHQNSNNLATLTAVQPPARFGALNLDSQDFVNSFIEKPKGDGAWINGGFFCLRKEICGFIFDLQTSFESEPLNKLVSIKELTAFEHQGWWHPMDTLRDKRVLESLWENGDAPWRAN